MTIDYHFRFDELVIDQQEIFDKLGYHNCSLPAPFDTFMQDALSYASGLSDIMGTSVKVDNVVVNETNRSIFAGGLEFNVGNTVCGELKGSDSLFVFVCTAGKTISDMSARSLKGEDPVLGYIFDILGSTIAEAATDRMQNILKDEIEKEGLKITNRYSPGYCHWSVSDQQKLFSLFDRIAGEVTLTPSGLMKPAKSVSGIIGIGPDVKYREYQCELCSSKNCVYRKHM